MIKYKVNLIKSIVGCILPLFLNPIYSQTKNVDTVSIIQQKRDSAKQAKVLKATNALKKQERFVGLYSINSNVRKAKLLLSGDTLFAFVNDTIYCINADLSKQYWKKQSNFSLKHEIVISNNSIVFSYYNKTKGVSRFNGETIWEIENCHIVKKNNKCIKSSYLTGIVNNRIVKINTCTGNQEVLIDDSNNMSGYPLQVGNYLIGNNNDSILCYNLSSGIILWNIKKQGAIELDIFKGHILVKSGRFLQDNKNIKSLKVQSGEINWSINQESKKFDFAVTDKGILKRNSKGLVYLNKIPSNKISWIYQLPINETLNIGMQDRHGVYKNRFFITSKENVLRSLNMKNGKIKWKFDTQSLVISNMVFSKTNAYVITKLGQIISIKI